MHQSSLIVLHLPGAPPTMTDKGLALSSASLPLTLVLSNDPQIDRTQICLSLGQLLHFLRTSSSTSSIMWDVHWEAFFFRRWDLQYHTRQSSNYNCSAINQVLSLHSVTLWFNKPQTQIRQAGPIPWLSEGTVNQIVFSSGSFIFRRWDWQFHIFLGTQIVYSRLHPQLLVKYG